MPRAGRTQAAMAHGPALQQPPSMAVMALAAVIAFVLTVISLALLRQPAALPGGLARLARAHEEGGWTSAIGADAARESMDNAAAIESHQAVSDAAERYATGQLDAGAAADAAERSLPSDAANELTQWYAAWLAYERMPESPTREADGWSMVEARLAAAPPVLRCTTFERQYQERFTRALARRCERADTPRIVMQEFYVSWPSSILPRLLRSMRGIVDTLQRQGQEVRAEACRQRVAGLLRDLVRESPSHGATLLAADLLSQWAEWQSAPATATASEPVTGPAQGQTGADNYWRAVSAGARSFGDDLLARIDGGQTKLWVGHATYADGKARWALLTLAVAVALHIVGVATLAGMSLAGAGAVLGGLGRGSSANATNARAGVVGSAGVKGRTAVLTVVTHGHADSAKAAPEPSFVRTLMMTVSQLGWCALPACIGVAMFLFARWPSYRPWPWIAMFALTCGTIVACGARVALTQVRDTVGNRHWPWLAAAAVLLSYPLWSPAWSSRIERGLPKALAGDGAIVGMAAAIAAVTLALPLITARLQARRGIGGRRWVAIGVVAWLVAAALGTATLLCHRVIDDRSIDSLVARSERVSAILGDDWTERYFADRR